MESVKNMIRGSFPEKKRAVRRDQADDFTDLVFSWSLEDIFDESLYENQVEKIQETFQSVEQYFASFVFPLLEETRADLASSMEIIQGAPFAEVVSLDESKKPQKSFLYDISVDYWRNRFSERGKEPYKTLPGDVVIISDSKPEFVTDLQRVGWTWTLASVTQIAENEDEIDMSSTCFKVKASREIEVKDTTRKSLFVVFLVNMTTQKRIWNALHMFRNLAIINQVLSTDSEVEETCKLCCLDSKIQLTDYLGTSLLSELNESQTEAILACLRKFKCNHKSTVELIWGPPGTGKTKTISVMLFTLLKMNCRTLICAPTNVAIKEVASRVLKLVTESFEPDSGENALFCPLGDILLFGNKDRLKVNSAIQDIYIDYRADRLAECLGTLSGWRHCLATMIDFLEDCVSQYHVFIENEMIKEKEQSDQDEDRNVELKSFLEFVRERWKFIASPLRNCILIFCTHFPKSFILAHNYQNMKTLVLFLEHLERLLFNDTVVSEELEAFFSRKVTLEDFSESIFDASSLLYVRGKCVSVLGMLRCSLADLDLPNFMDRNAIRDFCFQNASLILCTASSSYKLFSVQMKPMDLLIVDEAAQLKECESSIPIQLPGLRHAILFGDECQLPAMVTSNVSRDAGFGRSLFERLSSLGHSKHLLNMQYRMHPSISIFPNAKFYLDKILDAPVVRKKRYEKNYLPGSCFGPYSFINVVGGKEEVDNDGHSRRNMVEVAIVVKMVQRLYRVWNGLEKLSIGVISPYAAQVVAIQDRISRKYENLDGFTVKVKAVDGFQGGEEDIIIISTVRSNSTASIGFVSSPQRTNVALTRARHCLWILGNERTLAGSGSVWQELIRDARDRHCFFNADEDKEMAKTILDVKKEIDQLDDLFYEDSVLFKNAIWKVFFSFNFRKSFGKLISSRKKKAVINLLLKLSNGWRPRKTNVDSVCENASQILKQFKVEGLYVVCTIDIVKESSYIQVLKVWDLLPLEEIPKLVKRLDGMFAMFTDDYINRCKVKCFQGDLEVPKSWVTSFDVVKFKDYGLHELDDAPSGGNSHSRGYVENSRVSESLLLMKFYSLSSGAVSHLLSGRDGGELDLPFQVTDEQREMIFFPRSTFILGRSGTGKTTVLTMKLFQKEQQHYIASKGFSDDGLTTEDLSKQTIVSECDVENKRSFLRQLFVTVSPKLCYAVKQHISGLKRFASGEKFCGEHSSIDLDDTGEFNDIPDSFVGIPPNRYPLVITYQKFLMMLDGTVGNSFFERFAVVRDFLHCKMTSSRSVALETFLRTKEVTYDRFCSLYWPHFNSQLTKKLDPSRVFTEIISHIKGGLKAGKVCESKLCREDYVFLSEGRVSTLNKQSRERIYDVFQDYEKMKTENCEFDLADLVNDLHYRLRNERCECDEMDFVYIDEVQDLTMRQIALFRYICRNVDEGFVFAGDTAQTIARGIDFRFQDIRSLFFHEFLLESKTDCSDARKEKGQISEILCLKQNFRTHDGVLRLAQSVVELLYRFFQQFVDILKPEMSRICGEDPVLLQSGNDENAIVTIFGKSGRESVTGNIVGFGAEQVILVRDDTARKEILAYVGKQALVLTIIECKGLEFQDVLLYNFFGSSPLKNHWRVIYEYMEEQDRLDANGKSFPRFSQTKHNVLCSELKQLYVAITRTRQRLWICENIEEISRPMFDYWKKMSLVQVRKLDDSLALAMQVASSPEEWKARGVKLFYEDNYEMATMCFERAGDMMWEKRSKAAGLKATADRMRGSNPEGACVILRQAADIFGSIGKVESAAECFCELGEYEKAGRIYLEKCSENKLNRAGECFSLAGCYELAAEVYAKGNYFSECLLVCTKGKLFDMGLQYIQHWKQLIHGDNVVVNRSEEIDRIEQEYLEGCALQFYEHKDNKYMMKFVRAFHSTDSKRNFLRTLNCLDELLVVEEELGNFVEAAEIAKLKGDVLLEAELLGRAEHFKEASMLMLWYVFANSLWASGNKGWPLKHSSQDEEILAKAKSLAKKESDLFFEFVCTEINIILSEKSGVCQLSDYRNASRVNKSLRGEVLSIRKILDIHLRSNSSKYEWEEEYMEEDLIKHLEDTTSRNGVSLGTLICFWNLWKEKIENIFKYLNCLKTQDINESMGCGDFCLNYFGVRRQLDGMNVRYLLLYSDAYWVKDIDERCLRRNGNLLSANVQQFVLAARNHFRTELLSVGFKLLETLEALSKHSIKNSMSSFCQSMPLIHIFEVSKYLLDSNNLENKHHDVKKLQNFLLICTAFFENVFPLDWRKSLAENMISLRRSELSRHLLEEIILVNINLKGEPTYGQIGRVVMIMLGSGKSSDELCSKILKRFEENFLWKAFIEETSGNAESEISQDCAFVKVASMCKFFNALEDTYRGNWRAYDYISPNCFFYLVERLLMWVSCSRANFLTTKSSFLEWIISERPKTNGTANFGPDFYLSMKGIFDFLATVIQQLLFEKKSTTEWINKSGLKFGFYYPLLLLRLVVTLCLICVNCGNYFDILLRVLGRDDITSWLPWAFTDVLRRRRQRNYLIMDSNVNASILAEAFMKIGNPLVIVSLEGNRTKFTCPNAIFVDMNTTSCTEDILKILFPINSKSPRVKTVYVKEEATKLCTNDNSGQISEAPSSNLALVAGQKVNILNKNKGNPQINFGLRLEILNAWKSLMSAGGGDFKKIVSRASEMKVEVENTIRLIFAAMTESFKNKPCKEDDDGVLFVEANSILDELKKLSSALDVRNIEENGSVILEHVKKLQTRRPRLETLLNQLLMHGDTDADEESLVTGTFNGKESNESKIEETSDSEKGKKPLENSSNGGNAGGKGKGKGKGKKTKKGKGGRKNK